MKKKLIIFAAVVAVLTQAAVIIYEIHDRQTIAFGSEYLIIPLFMLGSLAILEAVDMFEKHYAKRHKRPLVRGQRLTERTQRGKAVLRQDAFPEYTEETLRFELSSFHPFRDAVERLCRYEEADHVQK